MAPVLVVDDDPGIRGVIQAALEMEGYTVVTASNGREALDCIAKAQPALVLLDLQMPVMTGWDLFSQLHAAQCPVPIVFMTAGFRAKAEAERCGADGYLSKPFDLDQLFQTVEHFVH